MDMFVIQSTLLLLVTAFALHSGGDPEKRVASAYLGMLAFTTMVVMVQGSWEDYSIVPPYRVAADLVVLAIVVHTALRSDRWWVLWVGSAQLLAVTAHGLRIAGVSLPPLAYAVMERWPVWLAIVLTGWGTWLHARRARATRDSS